MFWVFGRYRKEVKDKETSDIKKLKGLDYQSGEIGTAESAACKTSKTQRALSEDVQSDMSSDTDSDDTDYDAMYSDGTDSDFVRSDGEDSDSSSEGENPSAMNNVKQSSRPRRLRVPSLAEIYLRSQSQPDRISTGKNKTGTAVATLRHEFEKRHFIEQATKMLTQPTSETRNPETPVPVVKTKA